MRPIKRLFSGLLLLLVSIILKYVVTALAIIINPIYYVITLKWRTGTNALGDWLHNVALANDQTGNVIGGVIFKYLFTKNHIKAHPFSDEDDTVSYVLARNKYKMTLSMSGRLLAALLNIIDPTDGGHMIKSIHSKIDSDEEALLRLQENKYFE